MRKNLWNLNGNIKKLKRLINKKSLNLGKIEEKNGMIVGTLNFLVPQSILKKNFAISEKFFNSSKKL